MKIRWHFTFFCFVTVCFTMQNIYAWDYPLIVDINHIKFDYNQSSYADDALNIRKNYSTDIAVPEWANGGTTNKKMAYIKNQSNRKIQADFTHNQTDVYTLHIFAHEYYDKSDLGDLGETVVSFSGGGPSSSYTTFTADGTVRNAVGKRYFKWSWYVTKVNGQSISCQWICHTGDHHYYIVLGAPIYPMPEPWTDVLDYVCSWANGKTSTTGAVYEITEKAYTSLGKNYWGYNTHAEEDTFHLTDFFNENWADCRDMSATVHVFTRAIGGMTNVWWIDGGDDGISTKAIKLIGSSSWQINWFAFHQVAYYNNGVYDACLKLRQAVGVNERVPKGENMDDPYKRDLFDNGDWEPDDDSFIYVFVD